MIDTIRVFVGQLFDYPFFDRVLFGNTFKEYTIALVIFIFGWALLTAFNHILLRRFEAFSKKSRNDFDDVIIDIIYTVSNAYLSFLSFYGALFSLSLGKIFEEVVYFVFLVWSVFQVVRALNVIVDYAVKKRFNKSENTGAQSAVGLLARLFKGALWILGFLFILQNLGVDVTSLVAGLGIGGVAIALALQTILGDLFSSFAIHFDKPFEVGDFIIVGDKVGTVEKIGIKTTRLRALQGEEIVISNSDLISSRVQNFKTLTEWRTVFSFGVEYDTPMEKMKKIPELVEKIVESTKRARFDRAHFHKFGDSALMFEVVYYAEIAEYAKNMDVHQDIHMGIKKNFEKEGIVMAFPTRTLHIDSPQVLSKTAS